MAENLAALTTLAHPYPGYVSINRDARGVTITVRSAASGEAEGAIASLTLTADEWTELEAEISGPALRRIAYQ
jgi:hypothetical protein